MKKLSFLALACAVMLSGCVATGGGNAQQTDKQIGALLDVFKAVSVSDDQLKATSLQYRAFNDRKEQVALANNKYAKRLARLTRKHVNEDGMTLNFKAYLNKSVNANATPDGSIRVYAGLMDLMNDDELLGVLGHEIGHVKLSHAMSGMRTAYMASAGRKALAASSGTAGQLADSELGALGEKLVTSQFSQSQETESDDYGLAFMQKHKYNVNGMESAFRKLAAQGGKQGGGLDQMLSTHPEPGARADRMRTKIKGS